MKARRHKLQPSKWGVDPNLALLNKLSLSATSYLLLLPFLDSSLTYTAYRLSDVNYCNGSPMDNCEHDP